MEGISLIYHKGRVNLEWRCQVAQPNWHSLCGKLQRMYFIGVVYCYWNSLFTFNQAQDIVVDTDVKVEFVKDIEKLFFG